MGHMEWADNGPPGFLGVAHAPFKPDGEGTLLTLLHEHFFDAHARDRHQHGWAGAIDKLEKLLA